MGLCLVLDRDLGIPIAVTGPLNSGHSRSILMKYVTLENTHIYADVCGGTIPDWRRSTYT